MRADDFRKLIKDGDGFKSSDGGWNFHVPGMVSHDGGWTHEWVSKRARNKAIKKLMKSKNWR